VCCSVSVFCSVCCSVLQCECLPSLSTLRIVSRSFKVAAVRRIQTCACENVSTYVHVQMSCCSMCCSVLQCAAVCCSVPQCVAVCRSVLQCIESRSVHVPHSCATFIRTATHCNTLQHTATHTHTAQIYAYTICENECGLHLCTHLCGSASNPHVCMYHIHVCCSVLQCVAVESTCVHVPHTCTHLFLYPM